MATEVLGKKDSSHCGKQEKVAGSEVNAILFFCSPQFRTPVIARCVSLTAWAASALLMVPVFMYAATLTKPNGGHSCNIFWPLDDDPADSPR